MFCQKSAVNGPLCLFLIDIEVSRVVDDESNGIEPQTKESESFQTCTVHVARL